MADSIESKQKLSEVSDEQQVIHSAPDIDEEKLDLGELLGVLIENRWHSLHILANRPEHIKMDKKQRLVHNTSQFALYIITRSLSRR